MKDGKQMAMTITQVLLLYLGMEDASALSDAAKVPEQNKKIVTVIEKADAQRIPLVQWSDLAAVFELPPQEDAVAARDAILQKVIALGKERTEPEAVPEEKPETEPEKVPETQEPPPETPPEKKPSKVMKTVLRIWNVITTLAVVVVVILAVLLAGVRVFGLQVFSVLSGSMEPEYHVGALIYVQKVDPYTLQVGDDITFLLDEKTVATHRIVGILPDETDPTVIRFRTQGIANDNEDGTPVHYKNVVGKPIFTIPYLGYVANFIQNPPGTYVAISLGALLLFLIFLPDVFTEDDSAKTEQKPKKKAKGKNASEEDADESKP